MERDSFIFYRSFFEASKPLTTEQKSALFDTICTFALDHEDKQNDDPIVNAMFSLIKPQLEANYTRFLNGKKAKQKQTISKTEAKHKQKVSEAEANVNVNVNDNVNVNVNVNEKEKEKRKRSFSAPSLLEVKEVFIEKLGNTKNSNLEAELFFNFYGSKNWHVGKTRMKNYKMAVAGWITRKKLEKDERPNKQERINQLQASTERQFGVSL